MSDPYQILDIPRNASIHEIKSQFRKLALKYHPDRNKDSREECESKFKEIKQAYDSILKNYDMRNNCDHHFNNNDQNNDNDNLNTFKQNIINKGKNLSSMLYNLKNMEFNNLFDIFVKEVSSLTEYYENKDNDKNKKTDDLYIEANIEIFDIYNNIEKEITIKRFRKCEVCYGIGMKISKTSKNGFELCKKCLGEKYLNKDVKLNFESKNKTIVFNKKSHHYKGYTPGDIIINLIPKNTNTEYRNYHIINHYDLLLYYVIDKITSEITLSFKHFDNKNYEYTIKDPSPHCHYKIDNMGLLCNTKRGSLFIQLVLKSFSTITLS